MIWMNEPIAAMFVICFIYTYRLHRMQISSPLTAELLINLVVHILVVTFSIRSSHMYIICKTLYRLFKSLHYTNCLAADRPLFFYQIDTCICVLFMFRKRVLTNIDGCTLAFAQSRIRGSFSVSIDWLMNGQLYRVRSMWTQFTSVNRWWQNRIFKILIVFNC